jgi:RHS repeat-associated protein
MTTAAICATREVSWSPSFYRGEQYDSDLALYYLRARYYNAATGRFMSRDPEDGDQTIPATLHKYLYAGGDPINRVDRTGRDFLEIGEIEETVSVGEDEELEEVERREACILSETAAVLGAAVVPDGAIFGVFR